MLTLNQPLPSFRTTDQNGKAVSNTDLKGTWTVLYFYPKDETPGCTAQACSLRDSNNAIIAMGARVIGISKDTASSHKKFIQNHNLPFDLLVDKDKRIADAFGALTEQSMFGKKYMGIERSTFISNPEGTVVGIYRKVEPESHATFVLSELKRLQST